MSTDRPSQPGALQIGCIVNQVADGQEGDRDGSLRLTNFLRDGIIIPELQASTTEGVIAEMLDGLILLGRIDPAVRKRTFIALLKRESIGTTGLGAGVALPHAKLDHIQEFVGGIGISQGGVDFQSSDRKPVHVVFLLLSPVDDPYGHLNLMGIMAALVRSEGAIEALKSTRNAGDAIECVEEIERELFPG